MAKRTEKTQTKWATEVAFHEVMHAPPRRLQEAKGETAERMRKAIALDRARQLGARIPRAK